MVRRGLQKHRKQEYIDLEEQLYALLKQRGKMYSIDFLDAFPEQDPDVLRSLLGNLVHRYPKEIYCFRNKYNTSRIVYYHRDFLHRGLDILVLQELLLYQRKFIYQLEYQISKEEIRYNLKKVLDLNKQLEELISNYKS